MVTTLNYTLDKLLRLALRDNSYQIDYWKSYLKFQRAKIFGQAQTQESYDLVFIILDSTRGWILEAIPREIATYFPGKYCFHYGLSNIPPAKAYFFSHYSLYPIALKNTPHVWGAKSVIWYTHPKPIGTGEAELVHALNRSTKVVATNSAFVKLLRDQGVQEKTVTTILGGADPTFFQPHERSQGMIGFCSSYKDLKAPDTIRQLIQLMPNRKFLLLGRKWEEYDRFSEMLAQPNFTYVEAPYSDYPGYYAQMDVFVSTSQLEGGPIPLIESMMCNVFPVVSHTGFAPDIIQHGQNGFLFEVGSPPEVIRDLIEQAYRSTTDIRKTVEHLSWENFSLAIQQFLN
ncbi:glycosyltransferase family 4 protein [Leptolyngbya sp. AN03gr2]|uniref:glycosyltransferase family 4 protein n=1 Tax=unclassified Leptolyngbya TaxID=2650499 RepID=UPI003D31973F